MLIIDCEEQDFSSLSAAFEGEYQSDSNLALEIIFQDKEQIKELNASTRGVDRATDVLSYPALDGIKDKPVEKKNFPYDVDENGNLFLGSIVICREVAKEQAEEYGHGYERELYYLATHGVCHLLGYDHMEDKDKAEMRAKEERVLKKLGLER